MSEYTEDDAPNIFYGRHKDLIALHDREFDRIEFGDDGPRRNAVDDAVTRAREADRGVRAALGLEGGS